MSWSLSGQSSHGLLQRGRTWGESKQPSFLGKDFRWSHSQSQACRPRSSAVTQAAWDESTCLQGVGRGKAAQFGSAGRGDPRQSRERFRAARPSWLAVQLNSGGWVDGWGLAAQEIPPPASAGFQEKAGWGRMGRGGMLSWRPGPGGGEEHLACASSGFSG